MTTQTFDQLNNISTKWYSRMNATQKEKDERRDLSLIFADIILMYFILIEQNDFTYDQKYDWLEPRLRYVAENFVEAENLAYVNDWSRQEAEKIIEATDKHLVEPQTDDSETITFEEFDVSIPESEYWTSDIRGILIGMECASSVANYRELYDALQRGFSRKVWITEADDRVRPTHREVDHDDIPITDLFLVGESYLLFPGDVSNGAAEEEVANCRCHCRYY